MLFLFHRLEIISGGTMRKHCGANKNQSVKIAGI